MLKYRTYNFLGNDQFDIELPPGMFKGIGLSFEFTNAASQTLTPSNLGQIRLFYRGERVWEATIDKIMGLVRRKFPGAQRLNSSAGTAGDIFAYIPLHFHDGNIVQLGGDEWYVQFVHSSLSSIVTACNLTLLPQPGFGFQRYMPIYNDYNIRTLSAESKPERFLKRNLAYVTIDVSSNHTNIRLDKDGNPIYDVTDEQLEHSTNMEGVSDTYAVGAASSATAIAAPWLLDLYKERNLAEVWSRPDGTYSFGVVSTDASVTGVTVEFQPSPLNFEVTAARVAARLQKVDPAAAKLSA